MNTQRQIAWCASVVAGCALVAPAAHAQKRGVTYTGVTSQGDSNCRSNDRNDQPCTATARVSKSGKRVAQMQIYFFGECEDGKVFRSSTVFKRARIKKGKFTVRAHYQEPLSDGTEVKNTVTTHGSFGKKLRGDYSITSKLTFPDGTKTTCESGKVTFALSP
jgi:hypothetical protein